MSQFIEMFGNPVANNRNWPTLPIAKVAPEKPSKNRQSGKVWILNLDMIESDTGKVINKIYDNDTNLVSVAPFDEGNILFSKLRPYLNKVVIPNDKGYATTELVPLRPDIIKLNLIFLSNLLRSDSFVNYANSISSGTKMPRMPLTDLRKFECILPPITMQKEFTAIVEQADKSKFIGFKSQFIEMFGNPNRNTKGFNQYAISDIFDLQMGKTPERDNQNYWNKGVNIWISISDMQDDCKYVGDSKEYITDMAVSESGIKIIPQGTLLMSFKLTIGRVAIADKDIYTNEAIMAFKDKCVVELSQQWLYNLLTQYDWLGNASQAAKGKTLNKEIIGRSIVSIPPIEMQEEFATIVQQADKSKYIN